MAILADLEGVGDLKSGPCARDLAGDLGNA